MQKFTYIPDMSDAQPGFNLIINRLEKKQKLVYVKLNHGIWEMFARLEKAGIKRTEILEADVDRLDELIGIPKVKPMGVGSKESYPPENSQKDDRQTLSMLLGNKSVPFWASGLMGDVLRQIEQLPDYEEGLVFVPSLTPWPHSETMSGMPTQSYELCRGLISFFTDNKYLTQTKNEGFTGNEFKSSVISGHFWEFISLMRNRHIFLIMHEDASAVFHSFGLHHAKTYIVPLSGARLLRHDIKAALFEWLEEHQGKSPMVVTSAGEASCTWLGLEAFQKFDDLQFIDLGGAMAAFSPTLSIKTPWVKIFSQNLIRQLDSWPAPISEIMRPILESNFPLRDQKLQNLACNFGVQKPHIEETSYLRKNEAITFVENKRPSFSRIADFLRLSEVGNQYTNMGPVARLLEEAIALKLNLPKHRKVVAVVNEETALFLACGAAALELKKRKHLRWVSSAFTLFSNVSRSLTQAQLIDCSQDGRFDISGISMLENSSFDGVIFTNVSGDKDGWKDIQRKCKDMDKKLIIDNTAALLDRPICALKLDAPMEIVSANHEKAWGHGDCGVIICNSDQEITLRRLANLEEGGASDELLFSRSAQISDLSAAAVLDRLERMQEWRHLYRMLQGRHRAWIGSEKIGVRALSTRNEKSPPSFTAFISKRSLNWSSKPKSFEVRPCNNSLISSDYNEFPNRNYLSSNVFLISNSPEMRLISRSDFLTEVRKFINLY